MNPRYGTQNAPTSILKLLHVSTHIIDFHFWKHSAICIISVSVSDILFNPCEVFPFLLSRQHYRGTYKLRTTSAVLTTTTASVSSMLQKRGRVSKSCHTRDWRNHPVWSKFAAGLRPAWDLLLTCFWHACDTLTQACDQVYDQVCSWLE